MEKKKRKNCPFWRMPYFFQYFVEYPLILNQKYFSLSHLHIVGKQCIYLP